MRRFLCLILGGLGLWNISAFCRILVLPHLLERPGKPLEMAFTFDTTVYATYSGSNSASLELYLFDQTSQPMRSATGNEICNPCLISLSSTNRSQIISVEDLINRSGGFTSPIRTGFAIINAGGMDPDSLALDPKLIMSGETPGALSVATLQLSERGTHSTDLIIPSVIEKPGSTTFQTYTFDSSIIATYTSGMSGSPAGGGAAFDLYLIGDDGQPLRGNSGLVCNPCSYTLDQTTRKLTIRIEDLIAERGGYDTPVKSGFAHIAPTGADPEGLTIGAFILNSRTGPLDVGVTWINPEPAWSPEPRAYAAPYVLERNGAITTTQFSFDTQFYLTYSAGLGRLPLADPATVNLFLYENGQNVPMRGSSGAPVCFPCSFTLSETNRRHLVNLDALISEQGFDRPVKLGQALLEIGGGGAGYTTIHGQILNSHNNSNALSIYPLPANYINTSEPPENTRTTIAFPLTMEKAGRTNFETNSFDANIYLFYTGGLIGMPGSSVTVRVYLLDGVILLQGQQGAVCAPCSFQLDHTQPSRILNLENLIGELTLNNPELKNAYAFIDVEGDAQHLSIQSTTIHALSSPFHASFFGSQSTTLPQRLILPAIKSVTRDGSSLQFAFYTEPGFTYYLEVRRVSDRTWGAIAQIEGNGTERTLNASITTNSRFFRLRAEQTD